MKYRVEKIIVCIVLSVISIHFLHGDPNEEWTWFYQKKLTSDEILRNKEKKDLIFYHETKPFSQLVFSWNAVRPTRGNFIFFVQTRNAETRKWGSWHKMMAWGASLQESYRSEGDAHSKYHYVRLEGESQKFSDAFRIKILAHEADLSLFKAFSVSVSDFKKFKPEASETYYQLPSVYVHNVPKYSQFLIDHPRKDSLCSPTSCSMLIGYLAQQDVNPFDFAEKSFDRGLGIYGSWPFNIAHAYERCGDIAHFAVGRFDSFGRLYRWLRKGVPVVVSVRGPLVGAPAPYAHGHLLAVVGWDQQRCHVLCHDPAYASVEQVNASYPLKDFLEAWERSRRLVYVADPHV